LTVAPAPFPQTDETTGGHTGPNSGSNIIIHVQKSGLFAAFAHDHVISAPVTRATVDRQQMSAGILVATKDMKVLDPSVSAKDRTEIQETMLGPKVLDADRFKEIRFQTAHVQQIAPQRYRVSGRLDLHGVGKDLMFDVTGGPDRYQGKTKLKQTDFAIQPVSIAGGTVKVKDEIEIEFDIKPPEPHARRFRGTMRSSPRAKLE
jgi:hypothetical protein